MSDGDIFREVNEEMRRDKMKSLWSRYGGLVIGVAVLIVVGVGAYRGWSYWEQNRMQSAGAEFQSALALAEDGKTDEARAALESLRTEAPAGYAALARLRLAAADARAGKRDEAIALYDDIAADGAVDPIFRDYARVQAATLLIDTAEASAIKERVGGLDVDGNPWRSSARELIGLSAWRSGDLDAAQAQFSGILVDQSAPANLRERADMMLALIVASAPPKPAEAASQ
jgi:hypothetical protein